MRSETKLRLEGVGHIFSHSGGKALHVLNGVNLDVAKSELVCLLGESGCGKTTLLRIIAGLEPCTAGRVLLDDSPVDGPHFSRCLVFQKPSLFPWLSVEENIRLGLDIRGDTDKRQERVGRVLDLMGLSGFARCKPSQLSGGMAQRAALARALINEPEVLLLDEPFGALDAVTRGRMQDELLRVWEQTKCTVVFVTHDIDEAILLGTRIVVMSPRPGQVREILDVPLTRPRARSSREFLAFRNSVSRDFFAATAANEVYA